MYIYIYIYTHYTLYARPKSSQEVRNRTGSAEPNRAEPFDSGTGRNLTRKRTEQIRTEPRRVRKAQAEVRRTGKELFCSLGGEQTGID